MKKMVMTLFASVMFGIAAPVMAATVSNLEFVGGCPEPEDAAPCFNSGNASETNVAAILEVDESWVTQINSGFSVTGIGDESGSWSVSDSSITHLAFKSAGYFLLTEISGTSGDWSADVLDYVTLEELEALTCPAEICSPVARNYTLDDFRNNGGNIADLSNVRAFSVVPIPAAVWLFGSALLGLFGWVRCKTPVQAV